MNPDLLNNYYNSLKIKASLCLSPGMDCQNKPIRAHSIQNAKVLELLCSNDHLIGIKLKFSENHLPFPVFDKMGRNQASTFEGLCENHDKEIFTDIDDLPFDRNNQKQLFLLSYRSVLKELHASMSKAIKIQTSYLQNKEIGSFSKDKITRNGIRAAMHISDAYDTFRYKENLDKAYLRQEYSYLTHRVFEVVTKRPILACSQLFSNDSVYYKDDVSRIIMNVFPVNEVLTYAIFSSVTAENNLADDYLYKFLNSKSLTRVYELSKLIIRNSENFFINPDHYETWSKNKREAILEYFVDTVYKDKDIDDKNYFMF